MKSPAWCYRFLHVSKSGALFAWEECAHGAIFFRSFGGATRGGLCVEPHIFEWSETWTDRRDVEPEFRERFFVAGRPVSARCADFVRSFIASQLRNSPT